MAAETPDKLSGTLCWDPKIVGKVINPEAAAPSIDVLLATHQPVPLQRVGLPEAGKFQSLDTVTEDEVLSALIKEAGEALIVPVIGPSGSGKSHFVLWLNAQLQRRDEPWRRVVYIPKGDLYLANVIDLILMGEKGPEFDRLKVAVQEATIGLDVETAAIKLRNAIAVAVGKLPSEGDEVLEAVVEGLPALLSDADYAPDLLAEDGAFAKAAAAALGQAEEEVEARFVPGDLPIVGPGVQQNLGLKAKNFLALLGGQQVASKTYEVLNEVRDPAMSEVFGIKPNQLVQVMRQLREELFRRDPTTEIVLMIEDFTLLQGVQYELLEAMLELPVKGGEKVLCEMKAVIAVTSGRFSEIVDKNDTLRTRLEAQGHIYEIDLSVGSGGGTVTEDQLVSFVGRYLNVVRAGPEAVGKGKDPPNACESCAFQGSCHPVFDADDGGHGLYPFNREFITNLTVAQRSRVNPRRLLNTLRRGLTDEADALRTGRFPSPGFLKHLEPGDPSLKSLLLLSPSVQNQIVEIDAGNGDRRVGVQTWWTREKELVAEIDQGLLDAFGLPEIKVDAPKRGPGSVTTPGPQKPTPLAADPINLWVNGDELPAKLATPVRKQLRAAVLEILGGESLLITKAEMDRLFRPESIRIEGSAGGGHRVADAHEEEFSRSPKNGVLFSCAVASSAGRIDATPPAEVVGYTAELHRRAASVEAAVEARRSEWAEGVDGAVRSTAMFALAAGLAGGAAVEDLLAGLAHDAVEPSDAAAEWFPKLVGSKALDGFRSARDRVFGFATGAKSLDLGGPISYDLATLVPPLEELCSNWELSEADLRDVPSGLSTQLAKLRGALDDSHLFLSEWLDEVRETVGEPGDIEQLAKRLDEVQANAAAVGVSSESFALSAEIRVELPGLIGAVADLLERWDSIGVGEQIADLIRIARVRLDEARTECRQAGKALEAATAAAEKRASLEPGQDLAELSANVKQSLKQLRSAAEGAREHAA